MGNPSALFDLRVPAGRGADVIGVLVAEILEQRRQRRQPMPDNVLSRMNRSEAGGVVSGPFRSVQRSGRRGVGELLVGGGDPAPGIDAIVIAGGCEFVDAPVVLLERFVAIALQHQGGGAPDIDLGYHAMNTAGLRSRKV